MSAPLSWYVELRDGRRRLPVRKYYRKERRPSPRRLRKHVGQLLLMGFEGVEADARLRGMLTELQPGGVVLFARNIVEAQQTHALLRECQQAAKVPLFRCVDMEGGMVDRLKEAVAPAPSAAEVAATREGNLFFEHGRIIGEEVRTLGFNLNFAPVLDLKLLASKQILGTRAASPDALGVVDYAREFLRGLRKMSVLGCGKHFPGLGSAVADSHLELPVVEKSWPSLWEEDLFPYRGLRTRMQFVMVAHAAYPQVTGNRTPASLSSKWMSDVLRQRMRYAGLILSDDLEMGGALAAGAVEDLAVACIGAGADMFLVCRQEEMVRRAWEAVLRETERNPTFRRRVHEAAVRVSQRKRRPWTLRQLPPAPSRTRVEQLQRTLESLRAQVEKANQS